MLTNTDRMNDHQMQNNFWVRFDGCFDHVLLITVFKFVLYRTENCKSDQIFEVVIKYDAHVAPFIFVV